MNKYILIYHPYKWLGVLLLVIMCSSTYGQKSSTCKVPDGELKSVKYRIGHTERSVLVPGGRAHLSVNISIKPEQINHDYLILLARHVKQRFCKEDKLIVGIFDKHEAASHFDPDFKESLDALRGEYFLDRCTGEEYIEFSNTPNYYGNPRQRIRIKLGEASK